MIVCLGMAIMFGTGAGSAQTPENETLNRAIIRIDTLSCGGCFSAISESLSSLDGYSGMGANLFRKLIAVDFGAPLTPEKIFAKLAEAGYTGQLEGVEAVSQKESFAYRQSNQNAYRSDGGCCSRRASLQEKRISDSSGGSCCALPPSGQKIPQSEPTENL